MISWLKRKFKPPESRTMTQRDPEGWIDLIGPATAAGVRVTPQAALGVPAALRAVTLLSGAVASLPLKVYRRTADGREGAPGHHVHKLLHQAPNPQITPYIFKERIMLDLLTRGNHYSLIDQGALWPLDPAAVSVEQDKETGAITYRVSTARGQQVIRPEDMLHVVGMTFDGLRGVSPITLAREALAGAIAELKHGHGFFRNGANLSGVLQHPGHLGPDAAETLRQSWRDKYSGSDNAGKVAVLEEGMTFAPVSLSNKDSQWLESRQVSVLDTARIFGVPPALLGHLEKASYSSQEAQNLEFLTHSLRPWLARIVAAIDRALLGGDLYCEFTTADLVRTALKDRYDAYRVALAAGFMTANEVRRLENLPRVDGGDTLFRPLNMGVLGEEDNDGNQQGN